MTNNAFYAYCRDQRKMEPDQHKRQALTEVYNYMRECGVSKAGVATFIDYLISHEASTDKIAAYQWLSEQFAK